MKKKNILIIGGSSELGKNLINNLEKKKFIIYRTTNNQNIANSIKANFDSLENIKNFVKKIKILKIDFDYVFFLQGELIGKSLYNFTDNEIEKNLNINFVSTLYIIKNITLSKNSLTIFVSSVAGQRGSFDPIYAIGKSALINLTKSLSSWLAPRNRFICICPGLIKNTKMFREFSIKRKKYHKQINPNKELLNCNDLSKILTNLMDPHWRHANGSIININGGVYF